LKDSQRSFKAKRLSTFFVFALILMGMGAFMFSGLKWFSPNSGTLQATTAPEGQSSDTEKLFGPKTELFLTQESPFIQVAEKVSPAVVNIRAEKVVKRGSYDDLLPFEDFFRRFFGEVPDRRPPTQRGQSLGSGFIFREDGYIITNNHVVSDAENVLVKIPDGTEHKARIVGLDRDTDIAVLKIDVEDQLPVIDFGNSDQLRVGEWVMAIGNPFPELGLDRTVTVGVVSAKGRGNLYFGPDDTPQYQNYIQTDASINPGNSGGPLVNVRGEVVGINSAITNPTGVGFNIGIGFAIPINLAKSVIPDLIEKGRVSRGFLGITFQPVTKAIADARNLASDQGVLVRTVQPGTPADKAGIKQGDIITDFDGWPITDEQKFRMMVAQAGPGRDVKVIVNRDGKKLTKQLILADRDKFVSGMEEEPIEEKKEENWLGLELSTSTKELVMQYGSEFKPGVLVVGLESGSPADLAGFHIGDIITQVNDREIENLDDYRRIVRPLSNKDKAILFLAYRNGEPFFVAVKPK
jgi:Do/DeqQ family serine protease